MRRVGISYRQARLADRWDAIVVGSGMGGLAAAALLAKRKRLRVLVLERHYTAGGFTHVFTRPGYEWDVGVHYIGQVGEGGAMRIAFDEVSDGTLQWAPMPAVYDRAFLGPNAYDFVAGHEPFIETMSSYFPSERDAIVRYVAECQDVTRNARWYYLDKAVKPWVSTLMSPMLRRGLLKSAVASTWDVLSALTKDRELIGVLTAQYGDYGLPPKQSSFAVHALVAAHYLGGAWYPVGGASAIARSIEPVISSPGGAVCTNAEVDRILVRSGRAVGVRLADGNELTAPIVISDAGAAITFSRLLREGDAQRRPSPATPASVSWVCLYVGLDRTDAQLGLTGTNWWMFPGHDHDAYVSAFEKDPYAPLPVVFASFPSAKDPSWAARYPGRATMELVAPVQFDWFRPWADSKWMNRGSAYEVLKGGFRQRLLEVLETRWPQVKGHVKHAELSTPLSARHFASHPRGELYGLSHSPERVLARIGARTRVRGLYLTGADITTAGVSGALVGGIVTASAIMGIKVMSDLLTPRKRVGRSRRVGL
jgi:all-trans-retinol 13,14-reductase